MLITLDQISNFMFENFERVKVSKNGCHYLAKCALCGDSKKSISKRRFNLDYNNGDPIYHCFNCGKSGSFIQLYSLIKSISIDEAKKEFSKFDISTIKKSFKKKKIKELQFAKPNIAYHDYILSDCISLDNKPKGLVEFVYQKALSTFIKERNIHNYKLYIAYKGKYKGRIIIPILDDKGHIIFFQGRAINDNPNKYDNPPVEKGSIILNEFNFDRNKNIIITEGIFDALTIGNQGTTCFGAFINDDFLSLIFKKTDKKIIIALDNDESGIEGTLKILNNSKYSNNLLYFLMPEKYHLNKDINMLDGKIKNIYDFIINNSYSKFEYIINMKLRRK